MRQEGTDVCPFVRPEDVGLLRGADNDALVVVLLLAFQTSVDQSQRVPSGLGVTPPPVFPRSASSSKEPSR
jgi:hypothetical protein